MAKPWGRSDEIGRLLASIDSGRSVLVTGQMGVGKTVLLRHAARRLREQGVTVTEIAANAAAADIPFGALTGLIDPNERAAPATQIAAATDRIARISVNGPSVLFIDDAPHLDLASISVIHRVVTETNTVLMASLRNSDTAPAALGALWRHAEVDRFELAPLDHEATISMVAAALPADTADHEITSLARRSAGNPLFATELVRAFQDGTPTGLTPHLVDLVERRIAARSATEQDQLTIIAIGQPLDTALDIVDIGSVTALEAAGLVRTERDDDVVTARPAHPLHSEVIRTRLSPIVRRALSDQLGHSLLTQPARRRGDALRVVNWLLEAGDRPPTGLAEAAALEAIGWLDVDLATRLATMAVDTGRTASSLFTLGEIHRLAGEHEHATDLWEEAFELADDDATIGLIARSLGQAYSLYLRQPDRTFDVLRRALDRVADPATRIGIESDITMNQAVGDRRDTFATLEALVTDPAATDEAAWTALTNLIWARTTALDVHGIDSHVARTRELERRLPADQDGEVDLVHAVLINLVYAQRGAPAALDEANRHLESAAARGMAGGLAAFIKAYIEHLAGNLPEAIESTRTALAAISAYDTFNARPMIYWFGSMVARHLGDDELGERWFDEAVERSGGDAPWQNIWMPRAQAWRARAEDDLPTAVRFAIHAGKNAMEMTEIGWGASCFHDAVIWGSADEVNEQLRSVRPFITDMPVWELQFEHAEAAARRSPGALAAVAREFEATGSRWYAAAAWANRAVVVGDRIESCRDATRAVSAGHVRGIRPDAVGLALSGRRLDVAQAAASGATSRDIADALFLSPRTVDNHLREVYHRLGIRGRVELADAFMNPHAD